MNTIKFNYPKGATTAPALTKKFKDFREAEKAPTLSSLSKAEIPTAAPVKGVHLFAKDVAMIHSIASSTSPLAEAITNQKVTPDQIIGTLSSALLTLEFVKMQSTFKTAIAAAKTAEEKKKLNASWEEGVNGFKLAYGSIGLKGVGEENMVAYSKELVKNKNAFDSIVTIQNSRQVAASGTSKTLDARSVALGKFETELVKVDEALIGNLALPRNLCATPFAQGSFTKHFGHSFNLRVSISFPCVLRWIGPFGCHCIPVFGLCPHTYTIASLSYNVDLNVGYRVTCCGGEAWGFASANVCASLLGKQFCAGCSASIVGAVGIARVPSGSNCQYGLGLRAELKCTFAGFTVLHVTIPFGYTLTGPCPPLPC
jgi:hypothetical protein